MFIKGSDLLLGGGGTAQSRRANICGIVVVGRYVYTVGSPGLIKAGNGWQESARIKREKEKEKEKEKEDEGGGERSGCSCGESVREHREPEFPPTSRRKGQFPRSVATGISFAARFNAARPSPGGVCPFFYAARSDPS